MPDSYVLDASAVARLFLDQPDSQRFRSWYMAKRRDRHRMVAPGLLPYELANILHRERARTAHAKDPDYARSIIRDAIQGIEIDEVAWARTWPFAARLTAYDACYLALADALDATLVTFDRTLARVARRHVPVLGMTLR